MYLPSVTIRKVPKRKMLSIGRYEVDTEIVIMTMDQYQQLLKNQEVKK